MMTAEQRTQLDDLIGRVEDAAYDVNVDIGKVKMAGDDIVAYVDSLLAAERAAVVAECAKAMDDQARKWSDFVDSKLTIDRSYAQGRINAFTEAEAAIRKLGEKHE